MIELNVPQNGKEWHDARLANPGASSFSRIITSKGKPSGGQDAYLNELYDEYVRGFSTSYSSRRMLEGLENEHRSRLLCEIEEGVIIRQTGLCYRDDQRLYHCSPDGLIDPDGGFETKDALPHIQIERLQRGNIQSDHWIQVQGCLFVTGRKWWIYQSYCEGMKPLRITCYPELEFHKKLEENLNDFMFKFLGMVNRNFEYLVRSAK